MLKTFEYATTLTVFSLAMLNKVHFTINVLSLLLVAIFYNLDPIHIYVVTPILVPVNIGVFVTFMYFYKSDTKDETPMDSRISSFIEDPERDYHNKIIVNEGKYLFYFNWGVSITSIRKD